MTKNELLLDTIPITIQQFLDCYIPICNTCSPIPLLKDIIGLVCWDKIDFDSIQGYVKTKNLWSIYKFPDIEGNTYIIKPGLFNSKNLVGFIITTNSFKEKEKEVLIINDEL